MNREMTVRCRRSGAELDPRIDDLEGGLCNGCSEEVEDEEYYEGYQDADGLDSMLGDYEGDW